MPTAPSDDECNGGDCSTPAARSRTKNGKGGSTTTELRGKVLQHFTWREHEGLLRSVAFPSRATARKIRLNLARGTLFRKLVCKNLQPMNLRRFGKQVARLHLFHQGRCNLAVKMGAAAGFGVERVKRPASALASLQSFSLRR